MTYDPKHLKWITSKTKLYSFIKPQKELKKYKKVRRIKEKINKLDEIYVSLLYERDDDPDI